MLFLCGLTCRIILYNRPCTSQRGIALPLWKPLLNQQQYPARITWRFLIRAGAAAPLSDFTASRKIVLKRRMASLISVRPRSLLPRVCRNTSGKLLSHPLRGLPRRNTMKTGADRACCCWLAAFSLGVLQHGVQNTMWNALKGQKPRRGARTQPGCKRSGGPLCPGNNSMHKPTALKGR